MADSLVIRSSIELLGPAGGTISANPLCQGAAFRLTPGFDFGAPQPTVDVVGSLLLDGERPFGSRASNRTITLPITIKAPNFIALAAAREVLMKAIDKQQWTLTWTRDPVGGTPLPLVFDCFRALPTIVKWGGPDTFDRMPVGQLTFSFEPLHYGRSDLPVQVAIATPASGIPFQGGSAVPAPPGAIPLDPFTTVTGTQWSRSTTPPLPYGTASAHWDPSAAPASNPTGTRMFPAYTTAITPVEITGLTAFSVWVGLGSDYFWNWAGGPVSFTFTLTDDDGVALTFSTTTEMATSNSSTVPKWT